MALQLTEPTGIQVILCDLGKTLVDFDHMSIGQKLLEVIRKQHPGSTITLLDLYQWFFQPDKTGFCRNVVVDKGLMSIAELCEDFCQAYAVKLTAPEFRRIWSEIFTTQHDHVIHAMNNAKARGVEVRICSSTNEAHWNYIVETYPDIAELSEGAFLTFEIGQMKSDPEFFAAILKQTNAPANAHLFIDDLQSNLDCAATLGIQGLLYTGSLPGWTIFQ